MAYASRRPTSYKIDRELIVKAQTTNEVTLAQLSRERPVLRALFRDAGQLAANLHLDGLRSKGDGQSEKVPHALTLYHLLRPDRFFLDGNDYVTHRSTLCISICFAVRGGDGTLLVKGRGITDAGLAKARRALYDVAGGSSRGPGYVEVLKKSDADRDAIAAWRATGAQTPKPTVSQTRAPPRVPKPPRAPKPSKKFLGQLDFMLDESHDAYPIACDCSGGEFGIVIRDEDALLKLVRYHYGLRWEHGFMKGFDDYGFIATRVSSSGLTKYVHPSVKRADDVGSLTPTATKRKAAGTTDAAPKRVKASPL